MPSMSKKAFYEEMMNSVKTSDVSVRCSELLKYSDFLEEGLFHLTIIGAYITGCKLPECELTHVKFYDCTFANVNMTRLKFSGNVEFVGCNFSESSLNANYASKFQGCCMKETSIRIQGDKGPISFVLCDLSGAAFKRIESSGGDDLPLTFRKCDLTFSDFRKIPLNEFYLNIWDSTVLGLNLGKNFIPEFSHALIGEFLRQKANQWLYQRCISRDYKAAEPSYFAKMSIAGLVNVTTDRCWEDFIALIPHSDEKMWALRTLFPKLDPESYAKELVATYLEDHKKRK
jgi:hypothetical protein